MWCKRIVGPEYRHDDKADQALVRMNGFGMFCISFLLSDIVCQRSPSESGAPMKVRLWR
jgi:hypothetical protein